MKARVRKRRRRLVVAAAAVVWWALLGGLWMLLVDTASIAEEASAVAAALIGAYATWLVLDMGDAGMRPAGDLPAAVAKQLARVPVDLYLLALALVRALAGRHRPGRFHELALELSLDDRGNGRRAAIELVGSLAPNTIVLGVDERGVIVHQLVARHGERTNVGEIGP